MRFHETGPDVPDELLNDQLAGNVVFFCGAGISIDAGQPTFWGLTKEALGHLRVARDTKIGKALGAALRRNSPHFAPPLDQVFGWLQRDFGTAKVERVVAEILRSRRNSYSAHHEAILSLSSDEDGRPFVVTTNFDHLFETVSPGLTRWLPPHLPDFNLSPKPEGVVYLHGRLGQPEVFLPEQRSFVLGSSDFGRAYLADGWATRFLTQLLDRRTVVLLGYSAGDPPVRYLLEGLNAALPDEGRKLFAFDRGEPEAVKARWKELGVVGISFSDFPDLWTSLGTWATKMKTPEIWRTNAMELALKRPHELRPFERGQVSYFARSLAGAKAFAGSEPAPCAEWLLVFDQNIRLAKSERKYSSDGYSIVDPVEIYGVETDAQEKDRAARRSYDCRVDVFSTNPNDSPPAFRRLAGVSGAARAVLPERLEHLSRWIANVMGDPAALWWAAKQETLEPNLVKYLNWQMDRDGKLAPEVRQLWQRALIALSEIPHIEAADFRWVRFNSRSRADGWTPAILAQFQDLLAFRAKVRPRQLQTLLSVLRPEPGDTSVTADLVVFGVKDSGRHDRPEVPDEALPIAFRIVRERFEHMEMFLGQGSRDIERLPAIEPDDRPGERYIADGGLASDFLWAVDLFRRLAQVSADLARAEYDSWLKADAPVLNKLKVFAWSLEGLIINDEVYSGISHLTPRAFWDHETSRELLHVLRARWTSFDPGKRFEIEQRIIAGEDGEGPGGELREVSSIGAILGWLEKQGCELSMQAQEVLTKLRARGDWNEAVERNADMDWDGRSGGVFTNTDPGELPNLTLAEAEAFFMSRPERQFGAFRDDQPFVGYVEKAPRKALAYLCRLWRNDQTNSGAWRQLMANWPMTAQPRLSHLCACRLLRLPDDIFIHLRNYIANWMIAHLRHMRSDLAETFWAIWDEAYDRLQKLGPDATRSTRELHNELFDQDVIPSRKGQDYARSGPVGILIEDLLKQTLGPGPAQRQAMPTDVTKRLERSLNSVGEGSDHAAFFLGYHFVRLFARHQRWAAKAVLPLFDLEHPCAEAAWTGLFAAKRLPQPALFRQLRGPFRSLMATKADWVQRGEFEAMAAKYAVFAGKKGLTSKAYFDADDLHFVLRHISDRGRVAALEMLQGMLPTIKAWKAFGVPFFRTMWPQEQTFKSRGTSNVMLRIADQLHPSYASVIAEILDYVQPETLSGLHDYTLESEGFERRRVSLCKRYPVAVLQILERVIVIPSDVLPYELRTALDQIAEAAPDLRSTPTWRRLDRLAR